MGSEEPALDVGGAWDLHLDTFTTRFAADGALALQPTVPVDAGHATPVPEPAGSTLLLIGCASYLMRRRPRTQRS